MAIIWGAPSVLVIASALVHPSIISWGVWVLFIVRLLFLKRWRLVKGLCAWQLVVTGMIWGNLYLHQSQLVEGEQTIEAVIAPHEISVNGNQLKAIGTIERPFIDEKVQLFYRLKSEKEQRYWQQNTETWHVSVQGSVGIPETRRNMGGFDYRNYLRTKRIERVINVKRLTRLTTERGPIATIHRWHQQLVNRTMTINEPLVRAYIQSLFLNVRDDMALERLADYQTIGIIHLFSISGFHVSFLIGGLRRWLLRLGLIREYVDWFALIILVIYGVMLGWPYGLLRVTGDYLFRLYVSNSHQTEHPQPLVGTLMSMTAVLLVNPTAILAIGFQLSYALAIALRYSSQFQPTLGAWRTSRLCFCVSLPFLLYHYQRFSWLALLIGPLYIWLFSYLLIPGLLVILVSEWLHLTLIIQPLSIGMAKVIHCVEWFSQKIAAVDSLNPVTGILPIWMWGIVVMALFYYLDQKTVPAMRKRAKIWIVLLFICLEFLPFMNLFGQVAMIDIGQGDTFLVILPFHRGAYLIDVAGRIDFARATWQERQTGSVFDYNIAPALRAQGVRQLDGIFLTHADQDHIGSLREVLAHIPTTRLYLPIGMANGEKGMRIVKEALNTRKSKELAIQWLRAGDELILKHQVSLQVLAPQKSGEGKNEDSLVMYGAIGSKRWLFTGDIVGENEEKVFQYLAEHDQPLDILKVSHHGSDHSTSNEWITRLHPEQAWFSVGKNNRYGHPSDRIIREMQAVGSTIYRTDKQGAVHYYYFRGRWWVKTVR
ncbi:MAG: DNA internalization-related competence protein ComEC/Rec2 [Aerococcus sp.]|nr:DNA internalization-related competence protein ComEC/Rec2 [Aerococcus sp.]